MNFRSDLPTLNSIINYYYKYVNRCLSIENRLYNGYTVLSLISNTTTSRSGVPHKYLRNSTIIITSGGMS